MSMRSSARRVFPGWWLAALACAALLPCMAMAAPPLANEQATIETLRSPPGPHWVWVDDIAFFNMPDGRATLVDGDKGTVLGMLSTGYGYNGVLIPKRGQVIYSPESYYSRGTRGVRTDVVTLYDPRRLSSEGEIPIPPKRAAIMSMRSGAALTDDDRFLLIYNFTPAQSVTVVDTRSRKFVGEIGTPGCALVYPTGPRSFFSICGDGALLEVTLDDAGRAASMRRTAKLFDSHKDPVAEEGVRAGSTWWFTSFNGNVYPFEITGRGIRVGQRWPLFSAAERAQHWRTGGLQYLAVYRRSGLLYVIVHQGDLATHKDPGKAVWVYDLRQRRRVQQIALRHKAGSILVSQDGSPLLFTCFLGSSALQIYDARTGRYLRAVDSVAQTPTNMVSP
ncbi:MAG TPA: amine dehydrogenase large subunit [Steroidobacteraceae bacterium]|nr:amine dehydrogenase large subunit [Steroidobacteraceae bacterium]